MLDKRNRIQNAVFKTCFLKGGEPILIQNCTDKKMTARKWNKGRTVVVIG